MKPKKTTDPTWDIIKRDANERLILIARLALDLLYTACIIGGLFFITWLLRAGAAADLISAEHLSRFENTHFWASYAVYAMAVVDFLFKMVVTMFIKEHK